MLASPLGGDEFTVCHTALVCYNYFAHSLRLEAYFCQSSVHEHVISRHIASHTTWHNSVYAWNREYVGQFPGCCRVTDCHATLARCSYYAQFCVCLKAYVRQSSGLATTPRILLCTTLCMPESMNVFSLDL